METSEDTRLITILWPKGVPFTALLSIIYYLLSIRYIITPS